MAYAPDKIAEHLFNAISGVSMASPHSFRYVAKISSNVTATVYPGRIVHLNSSGEFELGHSGGELPMILVNGPSDPGANRASATASGGFAAQSFNAGKWTAIPCTAAAEVETTEFDTSKTYLPNQMLAAVASNSLATGGRISNALGTGTSNVSDPFTDAICGIVSAGTRQIQTGISRLRFFTYFLPAAP